MDLMTAMYVDACTSERLTQRALGLLRALDGEENMLGARVSLYEHCLQTATRAHHDGADEDTVVAALLHDVGELMSPSAHGDVAAAMLLPYIRYGVLCVYVTGHGIPLCAGRSMQVGACVVYGVV
jgi:predicted HD phosphohydrolase